MAQGAGRTVEEHLFLNTSAKSSNKLCKSASGLPARTPWDAPNNNNIIIGLG